MPPLPCHFPFFLDGPAGECIGVAPAAYDGEPVARLTALRLTVDLDRDEPAFAPASGDLTGMEGLIGIMTLQRAYLAKGWVLRPYAYGSAPPPDPVERAAYAHLTALLP